MNLQTPLSNLQTIVKSHQIGQVWFAFCEAVLAVVDHLLISYVP